MDIKISEESILKNGKVWDMSSFLQEYTLGDSDLIEIRHSPWLGIFVLIKWDLYWNKSIPLQYDLLCIHFEKAYLSEWKQGAWHQPTISEAQSNLVTEKERELMIDNSKVDLRAFQATKDEIQPYMFDDSLTRTEFIMMNWSIFEILHNKEVKFSCYDEHGNSWNILKCVSSK